MLAARDQENLVHAQQTVAASKPLNQGVRALQPKTPGPAKTPFRRALNDENHPHTLRGKNNVAKDGPSKLNRNAFVTPAPNRAPLGMKTTNARGQAFKTPLPHQTAKPEKSLKKTSTSRRSAKSKIIVAPSEPVQVDVLGIQKEEDEPDYGYAPPPIIELPDPPLDFGYDETFPQFQGENMFRGYGETYYGSPTDENGISIRLMNEDSRRKKAMQEMEAQASEPINLPKLPTEEQLNAQVSAMIIGGPKDSRLDTLKARSAASALSRSPAQIPPGAMKGTKSSEQKRKALSTVLDTGTSRNAPSAVSKNTIGFPKAKKAPSILPAGDQMRQKRTAQKQIVDQSQIHPRDFVQTYGQPPVESNMWFRLKEYELLEQEDVANGLSDSLFDSDVLGHEEEDLDLRLDDDELFQMPMPE